MIHVNRIVNIISMESNKTRKHQKAKKLLFILIKRINLTSIIAKATPLQRTRVVSSRINSL